MRVFCNKLRSGKNGRSEIPNNCPPPPLSSKLQTARFTKPRGGGAVVVARDLYRTAAGGLRGWSTVRSWAKSPLGALVAVRGWAKSPLGALVDRSGLGKFTARRAGRPFGVGQSHRSARWSAVRSWAKSPLGALKTKAPPLPIRQRGREYLGGGATVAPARGGRGGRLRRASPGRWRGPGIDLHRGRVFL